MGAMGVHGVTNAEATIYAIGLDNATERTANRSAELLELATDVDTQSLKRCLERFSFSASWDPFTRNKEAVQANHWSHLFILHNIF